jgi:hypothetical protein
MNDITEQDEYSTDRFVARVNKNNLVVFVNTILVDPVRVENTKVAAATTDTFFGNTLQATLRLQVVHTLANRLAVGST